MFVKFINFRKRQIYNFVFNRSEHIKFAELTELIRHKSLSFEVYCMFLWYKAVVELILALN